LIYGNVLAFKPGISPVEDISFTGEFQTKNKLNMRES